MFTSSAFPPLAVLPRRSSAGFSLIEVMITLSIAAILMSVAIPSFQTFTRTNRIAAITNQLSSSLQYARSEAMTRGKTVTVCKSNDVSDSTPTCVTSASWQDGWMVFVDNNGDGAFDSGDIPLRVGQATSAGVVITGNSVFVDRASFDSRGKASAGTIFIVIAPEKRCITLNIIGRLRIDSGAKCT
ncbi:hypothetical protein CKO12_00870 [Chromatium okenii]|uniref:GspH/FimT family pseudopilin n=1 Tax=Chromatium okenii TaxID=61644 RepID=UPI00190642FA|nr:GspH/FimT family pseudopilin [Chromatium okenii]MBK1640455.1 hypothetical protein [Chromatium okenii]